ncbi:uncharacterized protein N7473_001523 [Penicillium subrubescens]|uniref:uncharacterized protein n=1 Tax=Penicillium subrubescens TaxID=1316194 RepID=UPI0025450B14|nr:uncharacterized protein N7473_001523 [Penicillium subrubescens]KAJ5912220.1 hypothetical protein N7473_001523 [Penicillium subrubescens]
MSSFSGAVDHNDRTILRNRVVELEKQLQVSAPTKQEPKPPRLQVLYRLLDDNNSEDSPDDTPFEDESEITQDKRDTARLRCQNRVRDMELYLMRHPDISPFISILLKATMASSLSTSSAFQPQLLKVFFRSKQI